jgi:lipopolysaccharide transport system ATP-binding protein
MARIILKNINLSFPIIGTDIYIRGKIINKLIGGKIEENKKKITIKALDNITLQLNDGDRIGLVGHNGAGKSTLLSLLAGIYWPDSGDIKIEGKIQNLFDPNLGLEPEESGYKNILKIGLMHGFKKKDIINKYQKIIDDTNLGDYIHLPVRTYSSGMRLRLGFSVISSLSPEILLLDEMIGVGDKNFQEFALKKMNEIINNASILVLASHSNKIIEQFCNRVILLVNGKIIKDGSPMEILDYYQNNGI